MNTVVLQQTPQGEVAVDVYQKLAEDRILFICGELTDKLATDISSTLLLKDSDGTGDKITLFINSWGGDIRNALMICDTISMLESPINTVCIGAAVNEAALILACGTPGMRFITKNSTTCLSQLNHDFSSDGNLTDAKIILKLSENDNKKMIDLLSKTTGKPKAKIAKDIDRQMFLTSAQTVKYGLADKVVAK